MLNVEANKALAAPAVKEAFAKGGIVALPGTPEQFASFMRAEAAKYAKVIEDAKITVE